MASPVTIPPQRNRSQVYRRHPRSHSTIKVWRKWRLEEASVSAEHGIARRSSSSGRVRDALCDCSIIVNGLAALRPGRDG